MADYVIVVAGGKGLRMGGDIPKQFLSVGGEPILMRTIKRFRSCNTDLHIILVLPKAQQEYWRELCATYHFDEPYQMADGGETRFHSVRNGLALVPDDADGVVGVHDGVRPFVKAEVIDRLYDEARKRGAVIPVTPVVETLRYMAGKEGGENVPRSDYRLVQTPQTFDIQLLKQAYCQPYNDHFTDDASVVESLGKHVHTLDGNRENIKITTPFDMVIANALAAEE